MRFKIISFNHKLNKEIDKLINHYKKQVRNLEIEEYKPISDSKKENDFVLSKISDGDYLVCMSENGETYSSNSFASFIEKTIQHHKKIVFIIGKAEGIGKDLLSNANKIISLSSFTFPHEVAKLLLVEQIYRAVSIINNHPYHKN